MSRWANIVAIGLALYGCGGGGGGGTEEGATPSEDTVDIATMPLADVHFHSREDLDVGVGLSAMDSSGVQWAGGVGSQTGDDDWFTYATSGGDRFIPFCGQSQIGQYLQTQKERAWNLLSAEINSAVATVESLLDNKTLQFRGIGEIAVVHGDGASLLDCPANSSLMKKLLEIASRKNVAVSFHMQVDPKFQTDGGDAIAELQELLMYGKTLTPAPTLIWNHAGSSATPDQLAPLLDQYPNLHCELANRILSSHPNTNVPIVGSDLQLPGEWRDFFEAYSDRLMIGTDEIDASNTTFVSEYAKLIDAFRSILAQLSIGAAENIGYKTAVKLFGLK